MTAPSEDLEKLTLGDRGMVLTRAGAARARGSPSNRRQGSGNGSGRIIIESKNSGIEYDVGGLDEVARERAEVGLGDDNQIDMNYCTEREGYYAFHISDHITVRIGTGEPQYRIPQCTCGANEKGIACKHIYWLEDQLLIEAPDSARSEAVKLASDGSQILNRLPSVVIDNIGLDEIAENRGWVLHNDGQDTEEEMTEMLSVFEPSGNLPSEFKAGTPGNSLQYVAHSRIYKEFSNLLTQYAVDNVGMFHRLRDIITPDFQATVFFEKMGNRASQAFKALDEYVTRGPTIDESCDVITCADRLDELLEEIDEGYVQRVSSGPLRSKEAANKAASALIVILEGVVERNGDAYANTAWKRVSQNEPEQDRNLYLRLIGAPLEAHGPFVLDVLKNIPHEVIRNHLERLSGIAQMLESYGAPQRYRNMLRIIMSQDSRKRSNPEVGGSSSKKPMK
ncbi:uncharacterized protein K441DRAFT_81526 [Cenococcum geophilum 1.58]|uniref:uncharacterized protein n=1 Tax=Cenococcum geophilum 1.58 TaxID=794803 RepID=UPI00358DEDF4|nr:hypothetical protein K441DRAFT_81526 [Cenococcum geophilum 1.58]